MSKVAIKAFDAGHDILLFSHTDKSKGKSPNLNTYEDIIKIKKDLYEHVKVNNNESRLKHSIKKVLYLKARIQKRKGKDISELFTKTERKTSFWRISDNSEQIFRSIAIIVFNIIVVIGIYFFNEKIYNSELTKYFIDRSKTVIDKKIQK